MKDLHMNLSAPWLDEPNEEIREVHGLLTRIQRVGENGHLCGYVAVPPGHPFYGKDYDDEVDAPFATGSVEDFGLLNVFGAMLADKPSRPKLWATVSCHGGVTYSETADDELHWIGFDCNHSGDFSPAHPTYSDGEPRPGIYRDFSYVRAQVESLAFQLARIGETYKASGGL